VNPRVVEQHWPGPLSGLVVTGYGFGALGAPIVTGPTLTNVNDFRAILIESGERNAGRARISQRVCDRGVPDCQTSAGRRYFFSWRTGPGTIVPTTS
jgi:hypothetical protein